MKKKKSTKKNQLEKQLKSYATVAASVLASSASSQVIYTDIKDTTLVNNGDFFDIDFNSDGINDAKINRITSIYSTTFSYVTIYANVDAVNMVGSNSAEINASFYSGTAASAYEVNAFSTNQLISSSVNAFNSYGYLGGAGIVSIGGSASYPTIGQFRGQGQLFAGVRFNIGSNVHYGWVRLDVSIGADSVTIFDFAYDTTANASILAGDTGVSVGIDELNASKIEFFSNEATLRFPNGISNNSEFRVYDLNGKLKERGRLAKGQENKALKSNYQGVYIVELNNEMGTFRKKLWLESR